MGQVGRGQEGPLWPKRGRVRHPGRSTPISPLAGRPDGSRESGSAAEAPAGARLAAPEGRARARSGPGVWLRPAPTLAASALRLPKPPAVASPRSGPLPGNDAHQPRFRRRGRDARVPAPRGAWQRQAPPPELRARSEWLGVLHPGTSQTQREEGLLFNHASRRVTAPHGSRPGGAPTPRCPTSPRGPCTAAPLQCAVVRLCDVYSAGSGRTATSALQTPRTKPFLTCGERGSAACRGIRGAAPSLPDPM